MPLASTILMIRPAGFGFNEETAANNFFQHNPGVDNAELQRKALEEFDKMVTTLRSHSIEVIVIEDTQVPVKPDAIFPNNWLSTTPSGKVCIYPMFAPSRRTEKRDDILKFLADKYIVTDVQDWSEFEVEGRFLEGTGSMIMDHENMLIYAAASERTSMPVLEKFAATNGYQAIVFIASDRNSRPIYHTNVMMALGEEFAVVCEEAIDEEWELIAVRQLLESTGHTIIPITKDQMHSFAGNVLQVKNDKEEKFIVISSTAYLALTIDQRNMLEAYATLVPIDVSIIEEVEGGSVRCMMAEIFLERKTFV